MWKMDNVIALEEETIILLLLLQKKKRSRRQRRWYVRPLNQSRGEFSTLILPMRVIDEEKHREYFRMSVCAFDELLALISPHIQHSNTHAKPISPAERLAVTLRFLASGMSYRALAASYKLGSATIGKIVKEVCGAIWTALRGEYVTYPTDEQWKLIQADFTNMWNFPNCVGAIDGKHVRVRAPDNSGSAFYNYKGYFSFVLIAVCDARYKFTVVDIGAYGRDSDAGVFSRSDFGARLIQGKLSLPPPTFLPGSETLCPSVFVADEAFPLKVNLMRPYPGTNLTAEQRIYNYRHCRARRVVENAFGILAARWRIFGKAMECSLETAEEATKACIALHNYLCSSNQTERAMYIPSSLADSDNAPGEWREVTAADTNLLNTGQLSANRSSQLGCVVRSRFANYFQSEAGRFAHQDIVLQRGTLPQYNVT